MHRLPLPLPPTPRAVAIPTLQALACCALTAQTIPDDDPPSPLRGTMQIAMQIEFGLAQTPGGCYSPTDHSDPPPDLILERSPGGYWRLAYCNDSGVGDVAVACLLWSEPMSLVPGAPHARKGLRDPISWATMRHIVQMFQDQVERLALPLGEGREHLIWVHGHMTVPHGDHHTFRSMMCRHGLPKRWLLDRPLPSPFRDGSTLPNRF